MCTNEPVCMRVHGETGQHNKQMYLKTSVPVYVHACVFEEGCMCACVRVYVRGGGHACTCACVCM